MGSGARDLKGKRNNPSIESLEGRIVLSTFHASNLAQLRADVAQVNNTSGPNTIILHSGSYLLQNKLVIQNAGNLTIESTPGKGAANLVGAVVDRVLEIDGGSVTLTGLTVSGGGAVEPGGRDPGGECFADPGGLQGFQQRLQPGRRRHLLRGRQAHAQE